MKIFSIHLASQHRRPSVSFSIGCSQYHPGAFLSIPLAPSSIPLVAHIIPIPCRSSLPSSFPRYTDIPFTSPGLDWVLFLIVSSSFRDYDPLPLLSAPPLVYRSLHFSSLDFLFVLLHHRSSSNHHSCCFDLYLKFAFRRDHRTFRRVGGPDADKYYCDTGDDRASDYKI